MKKLNHLKYIYIGYDTEFDPTLLTGLKKLKTIHLNKRGEVSKLYKFYSREQHRHADTKIYLFGVLLNGPDDPLIDSFEKRDHNYYFAHENLDDLIKGQRLADEIPLCDRLMYGTIEDLKRIVLTKPVQDTERFLNFLKNLPNIWDLQFFSEHPQELFDRLPGHCAVQKLLIWRPPPDLDFLFRLNHLTDLYLYHLIDLQLIRKVLEKLEFLWKFKFLNADDIVTVKIDRRKRLRVWVKYDLWENFLGGEETEVADLNAAIEFILEIVADEGTSSKE